MSRLALLMAIASVGATACDEDFLNPMAAEQPRAQAYAPSAFFADGLAMRQLPEGTVPRERIVGKPELTTGRPAGAAPEVYVMTIPVPVDRKLLELGRKRFNIICATCHGPVGDGNSIVAAQMALRPPPSLHLYNDRPVGYFFEVITHGFGMMASYAAELPIRERWAVVAYTRALQLSQASPMAAAPPDEQAQLGRQPR